MWRHVIGLQVQLIAWAGMMATRGNSTLFLEWFDLYRQALVYRGVQGNALQAALREALHQEDLL